MNQQTARSASGDRKRILIVEDDPVAGPGIATLLEMEGYETLLVETGADCRLSVSSFDPQLVVLDVGLPDVDGITLFHELLHARPRLPLVISTGHADATSFAEVPPAARFGFLQKPYPIDRLIELIVQLTE